MSGGTYVWMPLPAEPEPVNLPCPEDCGDYPAVFPLRNVVEMLQKQAPPGCTCELCQLSW